MRRVPLALAVALLCRAAAPASAETNAALAGDAESRKFTWQKSDTSVALLNNGHVVWRHAHDRKTGKPSMSIHLLDGTELTRPWPFPANYPRNDHVWHKGLWWSWKGIDGINFWEEHQEGTNPTAVAAKLSDDGSARIEMTISYHLPDGPPLATEKRIIEVTAPDRTGSYMIHWQAEFAPGGDKPVVFNRNGYGGLAIRFAADFAGAPPKEPNAWTFIKSAEQAADSPKKPAGNRWMAYAGKAQNGQPTCVAVFDHPDNPRYPTQWAERTQYPYLNPAFTASKADYTLEPGRKLKLRYGILIHAGPADTDALEKAWKSFAGGN